MKNTFNDIDELIAKVLAGEATLEEKSLVDDWIMSNDDNRHHYNQVKAIFERASAVKNLQQFDTDAAWDKVKQRLYQSRGKEVTLKEAKQFSVFWKVAASILLFLLVGYVTYLATRVPSETMVVRADTEVLHDTLPDGTVAFLNKQSTLAYQYSTRSEVRKVTLEGEAFFDIKDKEEAPFVIETNDVIIEDIGTTFNVKAYPESATVEVFVETGEVAFYTKQNPGIRLQEGETGIYHKQSRSFEKTQSDTNVLAYKTRVFNFYNVDLGTIVESLNEVYEIKVRLATPELKSCRLNVSFKGESIEVITEIIAETLKLNLSKSDNEIILDGSGCGE